MSTSLTPRDRRALALGALLGAPVLLFTLVVRPAVGAYTDAREGVRVQRALLADELALARQARGYPALLTQARTALRDEGPRLFAARGGAGPAAAMEEYVADRAEQHRVRLEQSQGRDEGDAGAGVAALGVEVQGTGDLGAVLGFLRALDTGPRLVRVERLALERRTGAGDPAAATVLTFSASLRGFTLRAAPARRP